MAETLLALDQGTTSTRAILFDAAQQPIASAQEDFAQHYPHSGWVEHDAMDLWETSKRCIAKVLKDTNARPRRTGKRRLSDPRSDRSDACRLDRCDQAHVHLRISEVAARQ